MIPTTEQTAAMLDAFQSGVLALEQARAGERMAAERALVHLHTCLEFALQEQLPVVWREATLALAEVYELRSIGDPAVNRQRAAQCRRKALR